MYATAPTLESRGNLHDGKDGLLTKAAVAGHRSVRRKTRRPRLLPGRCQLRGQVGSSAEVHFVRCLAREGRVWHLGVVLLDVEVDQGAETLDGIRGVEVFSPSCARIQCLPVAVTG